MYHKTKQVYLTTDELLQSIWDEHKSSVPAADSVTNLQSRLRVQLREVSATVKQLAEERMSIIEHNMSA